MAASKPTSWLSSFIHFFTHLDFFKDLNDRSGLLPSRQLTLAPIVCLFHSHLDVFGVSLNLVRQMSPAFSECSTPSDKKIKQSTSIDFAENQLFPSLISLSPLSTNHPRIFQHTWVRSSVVY